MQILLSFSMIMFAHSLVHRLVIKSDDRDIFKIETFGFVGGGMMNITLTDFDLAIPKYDKSVKKNTLPNRIGFVMRKASSESAAQQDLEKHIEQRTCILDDINKDDFLIDLSSSSSWKKSVRSHIVSSEAAGLYSLIFARCVPSGASKVSFHLNVKFINPGPNYLSAGDAPLPVMYFIFFLLFSAALVVWIWVLTRDASTNGTVHHIHYLMAMLLALKCLTLLVEGIRFHYISLVGVSEAWSIVYYTFAFLKGVMLFTVILLIGSGWSLMKSYLNDREKRIIMVVLSLQVLDNIAMVVLAETAPGSQGWLYWRDLLHLLDFACCCAILFPIDWSIKHLRYAVSCPIHGHDDNLLCRAVLFCSVLVTAGKSTVLRIHFVNASLVKAQYCTVHSMQYSHSSI
jgi:G protein-coupled receptor 107